jgi:hypothetical protein
VLVKSDEGVIFYLSIVNILGLLINKVFSLSMLTQSQSPLSSVRPEYYPIYLTEYLLDLFIYYLMTMDFDRLCKNILGLESKIRFAGVCDDSGAIKYGGQREGITNLLSPEETKKSNLQALARWALRNSLASKVGKGKYAMSEYEKIKRVTFPLEEYHLLLVTTEVDADHNKIIRDILPMLT